LDAIEGLNASMPWPLSLGNLAAQRLAHDLGLPAVGGSDAHTLATIGSGYTLFPGTNAEDLRHAILTNRVSWGGQCWRFDQHFEFLWLTVQQRSLWGALKLGLDNMPLLQHYRGWRSTSRTAD
jgi:predicted metal-dependent phosphoesterase TrpH